MQQSLELQELKAIKGKELKRLLAQEWEAGFNEAGRVSLIGPIVYSCVAWPISTRAHFSKLGFNDTKKTIAEEDRKLLDAMIQELSGTIVKKETKIIKNDEVDTILRKHHGTSVSAALDDGDEDDLFSPVWESRSFQTFGILLEALIQQGLKISKIWIDFPKHYIARANELLKNNSTIKNHKIDVMVFEKGPSTLCPIATAASVVARSLRINWLLSQKLFKDFPVHKLLAAPKSVESEQQSKEPTRVSSSSIRDQAVMRWLNEHFTEFFGYPAGVRYSSGTLSKHLHERSHHAWVKECNYSSGMREHFRKKLIPRGKLMGRLNLKDQFSL